MRCLQVITLLFLSQLALAAELNDSPYFKKDYQDAKKSFLAKAEQIKKKYSGAQIGSEPIVAGGETLSVDYLYIPVPKSKSLLVINSGTHGVEAHVGSAVQLFFLDQFVEKENLTATSVLIIHGLNAFGFKNNRRVNENNVDLNRNFVLDPAVFNSKNEGYEQVQEFLNPEKKLHIGFLSRLGFIFNSVGLIVKYSMESLRRAVVMGQYAVPQGIFFGGIHHQPQVQIFDKILKKFEANRRFFIDLHTGYGTRGKLHLLSDDEAAPGAESLKSIFLPTEIDWGSKKNFYKVSGDITNYFIQNYPQKDSKPLAITFEYGTLDSQKTFGSIESLRRMVYENQSYHNGTETEEDHQKVDRLFIEMFYPSDLGWRQNVLDQSQEQFIKVLKFFADSK